ncbi:DCSTP protein, partial [Atractosteus spatula]|nr:DCSTP protein [Atractosteus spatula]
MPLKTAISQTWAIIVDLYTSSNRPDWRNNRLLFITCFILGFTFGSLLFVGLYYSLAYGSLVSGTVAVMAALIVTGALFCSKLVRCFSVLFLLACGMQEGRNFLITAGTGLVIYWNVKNTFQNLQGLASSMVCNLEKRRISIKVTPIDNYIKLLKWVGEQVKGLGDFVVVKFDSKLEVSQRISSDEELEEKLREAKQRLNATAETMSGILNTVSSVSQKVLPAVGIIFVVFCTVLFLRKYFYSKKFKNIFITRTFVYFDEKQKASGKPSVLPLTKKESKQYITIPSSRLTVKEWKAMGTFIIPVITHVSAWALFIGVDSLLYWLILTIGKHLQNIEPFEVPLKMSVEKESTIIVIKTGSTSEENDFSYSVPLFEKDCIPKPELLLYNSVVPLLVIITILILLGLLSAKLIQLKVLASSLFYPDNADERVQYLHDKILRKRSKKRLCAVKSTVVALVKKVC